MKTKLNFLATLATALAATCGTACSTGTDNFSKDFTGTTLRIDYRSEGTAAEEHATVDALTLTEDWAGPRKNLVDTCDLGDYRVVMTDKKTGRTLFLRGFSTLFGEWRTTPEARTKSECYPEAVFVPMPRKPACVSIECRSRATMSFSPIGGCEIVPRKISRTTAPANVSTDILISGPVQEKVDLTFISDWYGEALTDKFLADVQRFTDALFACPPFDKHKADFNVRAVLPGKDSTAIHSDYWTFDSERYLTTSDMKAVADATWDTPTDAVFILVNSEKYGGGGIYNFYAIGASDNRRTLDIFVHEFGHSFGALADEYFDSPTGYDEETFYNLRYEPWEPNITTMVDFGRKWKSLADSGEAGIFEGGGYLAKGIWRPSDHCMMRDYAPFCPVCTRAIEGRIAFLCDK